MPPDEPVAAPRRLWLHFIPAVLATILGVLGFIVAESSFSFLIAICGIVALVFAYGTRSAFAKGDIAEAESRFPVFAGIGWCAFVLGLLWSHVLYVGLRAEMVSAHFVKF